MKKEIGGMRLGSGSKLSVEMKNYERSTHDLGYIWRSSMAPGTLVPFMSQVALPGDTFDINLNAQVLTHPTLGPLFGSFKLQLDVFEAPIRLYQSGLMSNLLTIGNNMSTILLPQLNISTIPATTLTLANSNNPDNLQINGSSLLSYLGLRGWGNNTLGTLNTRKKNAIPFLAYWEIYKNYYANKQETFGYYLLSEAPTTTAITTITAGATTIPQGSTTGNIPINPQTTITINYGAGAAPTLDQIIFTFTGILGTSRISAQQLTSWTGGAAGPSTWVSVNAQNPLGVLQGWAYAAPGTTTTLNQFALVNIDNEKLLIQAQPPGNEFDINPASQAPYGPSMDIANTPGSQTGLAIKTYQSDLFNNWMNTTWFNTITTNTSVSTAGNLFTIDSLILARKVYELTNRIAIAGGSYNDWIEAAYAVQPMSICISPVYHGGLSKEIAFQEVVSLTQNSQGNQPLGTIAGRGNMSKKHKGGSIHIKATEISYLIGIVSITPRLDYSQGNTWDTGLRTVDDFHKPALDQIGFQSLITEQLAWWDTQSTATGVWTQKSAGLQPAWINYMTNVNRCYGNFADPYNEMFMTLNRRYTALPTGIVDLTTYINPSHYNFIFAQTSLDSQNFWTQIAVDITARRKMSAKIMPNL